MAKQLKPTERAEIFTLYKQNLSTRKISCLTGVPQSTVVYTIKKALKHGSFDHLKGNGRPSKLNKVISDVILKEVNKNSRKSTRKLAKFIESETNVSLTHVSIKNYLNDSGIYAFSTLKKPMLKPNHILRRFEAAEKWLMMPEEEVKQIIWSDESKFNLHYADGNQKVWRRKGDGLKMENICPTVKFGGGSVMVWACFSYNGTGTLYFIDTIMDAVGYCELLSTNLMASVTKMNLNDFIFMQDNDPKHKSKLAMKWFERNNVKLLDWPAQSPDMNPIENLWRNIKVKVAENSPRTLGELKIEIMKCWDQISKNECEKLAMSFRKRVPMLYRAKGGYINK